MAITEASLPLSIESFSYSWLVNLKPSFNGLSDSFRAVLDASDEAFFIEMDPRMPPSKRFSPHHHDLNLEIDIPFSPDSPTTVLNSDELFSSSFTETTLSDPEALQYSTGTPTKHSLSNMKSNTKARRLTRSTSLSKQIVGIYEEFFKPLYHKLRRCRSVSKLRADGSSRKSSPGTSPRSVVGSSPRSCYSECSISEAVLHCKRTIEKI